MPPDTSAPLGPALPPRPRKAPCAPRLLGRRCRAIRGDRTTSRSASRGRGRAARAEATAWPVLSLPLARPTKELPRGRRHGEHPAHRIRTRPETARPAVLAPPAAKQSYERRRPPGRSSRNAAATWRRAQHDRRQGHRDRPVTPRGSRRTSWWNSTPITLEPDHPGDRAAGRGRVRSSTTSATATATTARTAASSVAANDASQPATKTACRRPRPPRPALGGPLRCPRSAPRSKRPPRPRPSTARAPRGMRAGVRASRSIRSRPAHRQILSRERSNDPVSRAAAPRERREDLDRHTVLQREAFCGLAFHGQVADEIRANC